MANIIVTSGKAGGGHMTAMHSLADSIKKYAPEHKVTTHTSLEESIEKLNIFLMHHLTGPYEFFYRASDTRAFQKLYNFLKIFYRSAEKKAQKEFKRYFVDSDVDIIISTHFMLTEQFLLLKKKFNSDVKVIAYVPDFDEATMHFPKINGIVPDGLIAQSPNMLEKIQRKYKIEDKYLQKGGFVTRPEFTTWRKKSAKEALKQLISEEVANTRNIDPEKFTIIVNGGKMWTGRYFDKVKVILDQAKLDWDNTQIVVICGKNEDAFNKYEELSKARKDRSIIPLPLLSYEQVAQVYRLADFVILASIAPATMYEIIESNVYPVVVSQILPGQERATLEYFKERKAVEFIPKLDQLIQYAEQYQRSNEFRTNKDEGFKSSYRTERELAIENAKKIKDYLKNF